MDKKLTVVKSPNKDFKILQLTDTQIIDPSQMAFPSRLNPESVIKWADIESNCIRYVRELIESTKPDFIVLTGDNVYGSFDNDGSNFKRLVDFIDGYNIPWTLVFGNHDGETYDLEDPRGAAYPWGKGYDWQIDYLINRTRNCLFERGESGIDNSCHGNFVIEVTEGGKAAYALFMFDSHDCVTECYGLTKGQVDWYCRRIERLKSENGKTVPSIIFQHIPMYHHYLAALKYTPAGKGVISPDNAVLPCGDWGELCDGTTYTIDMYKTYSEYLWQAIQRCGSTKAVCVGHYHTNAMCVKYKGEGDERAVMLEFGVKSSTYDYGNKIGGTVITLKSGEEYPQILPVYLNYKY